MTPIVGRDAELRSCSEVLAHMREGFAAVALVGDAGIGKTTILEQVVRSVDARALRCRPAESEVRLAFAGLADLLVGIEPDVLQELPPLQRAGIEAVLLRGEEAPEGIDLRVVGNGLLSILRRLAAERPVLIVVDDLQWLDASSAAALAFALRRLQTEQVGVVVAVREEQALEVLADDRIARVEIGPMSLAALHEVIKAELRHVFARPVMVRLERACGGNPFYALAIAREMRSRDAAAADLPVPEGLQQILHRRLRELPAGTREALLKASVHPEPSPEDVAALEPAEEAGIVSMRDNQVVFAHPLYSSAIYASTPTARRRRLHRDLAQAVTDPEARARHLALAAEGPDEEVADALELAATQGSRRGASAATAELMELALRMTPPDRSERRARLGIAAADYYFSAGDMRHSGELLARAADEAPTEDLRAEALIELATVRWMQDDIDAAEELGGQALRAARDPTLQGAIHTRMSALSAAPGDCARHARSALALLDEAEHPGLVSFALHQRVYYDVLLGLGPDQEAYDHGLALRLASQPDVVNLMPAVWAALHDDLIEGRERYHELLRRSADAGDDAGLSTILVGLSGVELALGEWDAAEQHARDALRYAEETGQRSYRLGALCVIASVAAHRGRDEEATAATAAVLEQIANRSDPMVEARACSVLGFLALSNGDAQGADAELTRAATLLRSLGIVDPVDSRIEANHVEALVRLGALDRATAVVEDLERRIKVFPRPWARATALLGRGLIAAAAGDLDGGVGDVEAGLGVYRTLSMPFQEARARLVYGMLQRRAKRRGQARAAIEQALEAFERLGARTWAERARAELDRSGVRSAPLALTETEERVARLAARGRTNREIGEELFLSRRTVEDNLARVYRKLGIRSRAELGARLGR